MVREGGPSVCALGHRGFAALGEVVFRRSTTDRMPAVVVELGGREAAIPLRALQRELAIDDDSDDGRMLGMIAEALDYVPGLRLGDPLPAEVLTGAASWEPGLQHRKRAMTRLRVQLVNWLGEETGDASLASATLSAERIESDPRLRSALQDAFGRAARALDLAGSEAVISKLEEVAGELACIEALRDALLVRAQGVLESLEALVASGWRGDGARLNSLVQAQRLGRTAIGQIGQRFGEVDAQTGEVIATLRNIDGQRIFIRSNRDWLHRSRLAWNPILEAWAGKPRRLDEAAWSLIARTYQFLAQRYLPAQEWQLSSAARRGRPAPKPEAVLHW